MSVVDRTPVMRGRLDRAASEDWEWRRWMAAHLGVGVDPALKREQRGAGAYVPELNPTTPVWQDRLIVWGFLTGVAVWALVLISLPVVLAIALITLGGAA